MLYHEPKDYLCPFCSWLAGNETEYKRHSDIVLQDSHITAFISPKWWPNNPGNVIIIPNAHTENIYSIDNDSISRIAIATKQIAQAMRETYEGCTGISTRQHNEPDGNQAVWHFHSHVLPRYPEDNLYQNHANSHFAPPADRALYATLLRQHLAKLHES
ncbi:MAG TPA: HIT family protein [Candidatus Saccharibacteria bacterium]|nr:HIT family protein [Candidatus Saccharibacteria bacterium]HMR38470.1 HIT family protein [Candidatus Saccharibacteria bacterium]